MYVAYCSAYLNRLGFVIKYNKSIINFNFRKAASGKKRSVLGFNLSSVTDCLESVVSLNLSNVTVCVDNEETISILKNLSKAPDNSTTHKVQTIKSLAKKIKNVTFKLVDCSETEQAKMDRLQVYELQENIRKKLNITLSHEINELARSLYIINKSAKAERDQEEHYRAIGDFERARDCRRTKHDLYDLKQQILNEAIGKGIARKLGIHQSYTNGRILNLTVVEMGGYRFHTPSTFDDMMNLDQIGGEIKELRNRSQDWSMDTRNNAKNTLLQFLG